MKRYVYVLCLFVSLSGLISCSKNNDTTPASPVVGRWELNRGLASSFPASLSGINGKAVDLYYLDNEGSTLDVFSDNTFNENYRNALVSDGAGTWDFTNNTLTLKYDAGQQDGYTYSKTKNIEELTLVKPISYSIPISATASASGSIQWIYRK